MPNVNRGDRPLSPHLSIYNQSYTGTLSILHRLTGVAMSVGAVLIVLWLFAAASGGEGFQRLDSFLAGPFGGFVLVGSLFAFSYHFLNGIRHLFWDAGYGFKLSNVRKTGWMVVLGSAAMTAAIYFLCV